MNAATAPPDQLFEAPDIQEARKHFKAIIDLLENLRAITTDHEVQRHASIAITQLEIAGMCAVRALTGGK